MKTRIELRSRARCAARTAHRGAPCAPVEAGRALLLPEQLGVFYASNCESNSSATLPRQGPAALPATN